MNEMLNASPLTPLCAELTELPGLRVQPNERLDRHTRFNIGGPADLLLTAYTTDALTAALQLVDDAGMRKVVVGGGSNLIVSDEGFRGAVLRYAADAVTVSAVDPSVSRVTASAGMVLQHLVDFTVAAGLKGLETMTGIPGWLGAAVYGNAGAYGRSISELVAAVDFFDGARVASFDKAACDFEYRESIFKRHKDWIVLSSTLEFTPHDAGELRRKSDEILNIRNEKYPPTMKCAGSIFKNLLFSRLPARLQSAVPAQLVRQGKVPSAWFLEQAGVKGLRIGDIQVASYHANLIYNDGAGTARDLLEVIRQLKSRVAERFDLELEEEVQYVGTFA